MTDLDLARLRAIQSGALAYVRTLPVDIEQLDHAQRAVALRELLFYLASFASVIPEAPIELRSN